MSHSPSPTPSHGQSSTPAHSHEEHASHLKIYWMVFFALLVGTIITVWLNSVHFDSFAVTVSIALFVACVKATLVACYFMHLISERKMIYTVLVFTAFFFAGMMILTLWAHGDTPLNTVTK